MVRWAVIAGATWVLGLGEADAQIASGRLETISLQSEIFENSRMLRVWLPDSYDDPLRAGVQFPVLYLNDGQNLFDPATALFGDAEWLVDETVTSLIEAGAIPPVVVVGIDNAGRRGRAREYLPYPDEFLDPPEPDPQGMRYADFLADEVLPAVEERFRVQHERGGRFLGGSSYGALVALAVAIDRPDLFSQLLLESPSLYVDNGRVLVRAAENGVSVDRVYIGVGTNELAVPGCAPHPGNEEAVRDVRNLESIVAAGGVTVLVQVDECAVHDESAWAHRLPTALGFLLGRGGAR